MTPDNNLESSSVSTIEENRRFRRVQLPRPAPLQDELRTNLELALASDPRRRANYDLYQQSKRRNVHVEYLPIRLDIENVSRCNFRCGMCQVSGWGPTFKRAGDMSFEDFKSLVDEQYGLVEIKLHGMGEPLMGGAEFFKMIRYARSKHIWVRTNTNISLLHFRDNYKELIESGINEVQMSFDGATKETFESIRHGSNFEIVVRNSKLINDYCNDRNLLRTRMWVLLQHQNVGEFLQFVEIAHQVGFKRLTYSLNLHGWGQQQWIDTNRDVTAEDAITPELAQQAIERGRELGLEVTFWNITSQYDTTSPAKLCPWPFEWAYISSDLRVVPCCMIANPDVSDMGDAHTLTTTWNAEKLKQFRQDHLEGRIPPECQPCYVKQHRPVDQG